MTKQPKTDEEKAARAHLLKAIATWLTGAVVLIGPLVAYIEAKTNSLKSTVAVEKATSDISYEALAEKINKLEDDRRKLMLEVAKTRELQIDPMAMIITSSSSPSVERARDEIRNPAPALPIVRPAPPPAAVEAAERAIEAQ